MTERAIDRVLEALQRSDLDYRPSAHEHERWMAQCPVRRPLTVAVDRSQEIGPDRKPGALIHCFAGCSGATWSRHARLRAADLYDGERRTNRNGKASSRSARKATGGGRPPEADLGNTERLVAAHSPDLRYVSGLGWHVWNDLLPPRYGRRRHALRQAGASAHVRRGRAARDADARKELVAHAVKSESEARLRAMVTLAETEETVVAAPSRLDAHPFLLNVENEHDQLSDRRAARAPPR